MSWLTRRAARRSEVAMAAARQSAEDVMVRAFGRDRVIVETATDAKVLVRRTPLQGEPQLALVIDQRGEIVVRLDRFDSDDPDWPSIVELLAGEHRVVDVHSGEGGICCFGLSGPPAISLFMEIDDRQHADDGTLAWLGTLHGWGTAQE